MPRLQKIALALVTLALAAAFAGCGDDDDPSPTAPTGAAPTSAGSPAPGGTPAEEATLRLGYFPNITHAQPLVGLASGMFEEELGANVTIEPIVFNAGPAVIEALFAGEIDASYIGPNPAINGYVRSDGEALRIVAGATSGGAALVVRKDAGIDSPDDFAGKTIATPQLGNTQDVALRVWLKEHGLDTRENGGDVNVLPISNADSLNLFRDGEIDGAWVPEPWATRLVQEADGVVFLDEKELWPGGEFVTTHLIVRTEFLEEHPDVVAALVRANVKVTEYINDNPDVAKDTVNAEIGRITTVPIPDAVIDAAWENIGSTYDPIQDSLYQSAADAFELGFLGQDEPDLDGIYDLSFLEQALEELGFEPIEAR